MDPISFAIASALAMLRGRVQYRATQKKNLMEHPLRSELLANVNQTPGLTLSRLRHRLGCSWGTIQYHMGLLEEAGIVRAANEGRRKRVFPGDMESEQFKLLAVLERGRMWELGMRVARSPGAIQKDLTDELDMSRKTFRSYMDRLTSMGLVDEVPDGRFRNYFPTDSLREATLLREKWRSGNPEMEPTTLEETPLASVTVSQVVK